MNASSYNSSPRTEWSSESELLATTAPIHSPEQREVDISNLSEEDLQSLRQQDPFLYYSIPSVRRDELHLRDQCPKRLESRAAVSDKSSSSSTTVKRCTRMSFECHTDLLMDDLLWDFEENFSEQDLQKMDLHFSKIFGLEECARQ